jgi:hypothetical protein
MENQNVEQQQQQAIQQEPPKSAYNPLLDTVNDKSYSVGNVNATQEQLMGAIPEPVYQPQNIGGRENPYKTIREGGSSSSSSSSPSDTKPINPSMNQIPDADKKQGAKHMAKLIIDGYEQLHVFANQGLQFSQKRLRRLESEGEIDLSIPVPDGYGNTLTAGGFIQEFNEQSKDALSVTPQFKKEVTPVLERVLEESGAGLTDKQMLIYMFGKDIALKGVVFYQMRGQMNDMIEIIKEQTAAFKSGQYSPQTPKSDKKTKDDITTQPYAYAPSAPVVGADAQDFNFQTNEVVMSSAVQHLEVPKTGRDRVIAQRAKEKKWKKDAEEASSNSSYEQAMQQRKTGKRGRTKKTISDYVKGVDKEEITKSIILTESKPDNDNPSVDEII